MKQSKGYEEIFRDGQDTAKRNFIFKKKCDVVYDENKATTFKVEFVISNEDKPTFTITVSSPDTKAVDDTYNRQFFEHIYEGCTVSEPKKENGANIYEIIAKSE